MTTDLWMLVASAVLCLLIPSVYGAGRMGMPGGTQWAFGNREQPLVGPPWAERADRAHRNMIENLAPFAILVLTAHVAGKANAMTSLGAVLFFLGRLAHVTVYTAGIQVVRTLVFFVSIAGEVLILIQLFR